MVRRGLDIYKNTYLRPILVMVFGVRGCCAGGMPEVSKENYDDIRTH
jgi:hypothetical protein